jgi:hypothetical protein
MIDSGASDRSGRRRQAVRASTRAGRRMMAPPTSVHVALTAGRWSRRSLECCCCASNARCHAGLGRQFIVTPRATPTIRMSASYESSHARIMRAVEFGRDPPGHGEFNRSRLGPIEAPMTSSLLRFAVPRRPIERRRPRHGV